jgi:hypothetical protein
MSKKTPVQQASNMVAAASASLCFKNNVLSGIILSTRDVLKDNDEIDVVDGKVVFVGFASLDEQFTDETQMVRFVHYKHPKFEMIVEAARKQGIVTNEMK